DYGVEQILMPKEKFQNFQRPEPRIPRLGGNVERDDQHKREWVEAIQGGSPTLSNFDYSATMTEAMLLGNVAVRAGHPIEYDAATGKITNLAAANQYLEIAYRQGWKL